MKNFSQKSIRKIAVLRANALGDFIVTLPALQCIKERYPEAEIVLLGKRWHREFLVKDRTVIDRVIEVPEGDYLKKNSSGFDEVLIVFFEQMRAEHFDLAINFQGSGERSNAFIREFGAVQTAGSHNEAVQPLDISLPFYYYQNEAIRFMEIAAALGCKPVLSEPSIRVFHEDIEELDQLELPMRPFILLHPMANDIRRQWPLQNYPELIKKLNRWGYPVVITGEEKHRQLADELLKQAMVAEKSLAMTNGFPEQDAKEGGWNSNACGRLSLGGLCALIQKAELVIGPDTGPIHLARSVSAKTVGIYWAPNLINWGPLYRSNHRPVVVWEMACPHCGIVPNDPYPFEPSVDCTHEVSFVRSASVEQVLEQAAILIRK